MITIAWEVNPNGCRGKVVRNGPAGPKCKPFSAMGSEKSHVFSGKSGWSMINRTCGSGQTRIAPATFKQDMLNRGSFWRCVEAPQDSLAWKKSHPTSQAVYLKSSGSRASSHSSSLSSSIVFAFLITSSVT